MTWLENPSVCAAQYLIPLPGATGGRDIARGLEAALLDLARSLETEGCRLIGHIKALVQGVPEGHLYASLVSVEQGTSLRGELPEEVEEVRLTINVIVYGVDPARLPGLLDRSVVRGFPEAIRVTGESAKDGPQAPA